MALDIAEMNPQLIGIPAISEYNPNDPLQRVRVLAQVSGPNYQDGVAQAINGDDNEIHRLIELAEKFTHDYSLAYKFLSWIALNIGKGDPNCGNYFNWAGLLVEGNFNQMAKAWIAIKPKILDYIPEQQPIHPELQNLLDHKPGSIHFTAARIPQIKIKDKKLLIAWPDLTLNLEGNPPREIIL